ncbi:hypothetical protein DMR_41970 [Solidesulfovibrio magneticus RS-1]|uniref:Uncharacterized protein n=1 Tax=Solidesulfovibrio magneticus (strain ATCC 700980 / DSM 13731 / RS-1) TaxID=573370 RepID=C4XPY8_SOLM1|nr:hypothetical protein DMR_41970 [Solidesulfovibrio magneticus RS-1]
MYKFFDVFFKYKSTSLFRPLDTKAEQCSFSIRFFIQSDLVTNHKGFAELNDRFIT